MAMDTEESLKEYLRLQLKVPARRPPRPARPHLRLRRQRRARRQGDPHRRQAPVGGPGAPLRPRRRRRRRRPVTSSASSPRPQAHQRAGARWASCASRPAGCSTCSATRPSPAPSIVATPEEMPVNETLELAAPGSRRRPRRPGRGRSSTGCCPSCSAAARRRSSTACASPTASTALEAAVTGPVGDRARRAPSWR